MKKTILIFSLLLLLLNHKTHYAMECGIENLLMQVESMMKVSQKRDDNQLILMEGIKRLNKEMVATALDQGANSGAYAWGLPALQQAVYMTQAASNLQKKEEGDTIINLLVACGALEKVTVSGNTVLHDACTWNDHGFISFIYNNSTHSVWNQLLTKKNSEGRLAYDLANQETRQFLQHLKKK